MHRLAQVLGQAGFLRSGRIGYFYAWFGNDKRGRYADQHHAGHQAVGQAPVLQGGDVQGSGAGGEDGYPVTGDVGGSHGSLAVLGFGFDPVGVDGDILGGRTKSGQYRPERDPFQMLQRITHRHAKQCAGNHQLSEQHPAAPASEQSGEYRDRQSVDQWRPQDLDRVRHTYPAEKANGRQFDADIAQPGAERTTHQQQGKAGRKPQKQHADDTWLEVNAQAFGWQGSGAGVGGAGTHACPCDGAGGSGQA